MKDDTSTPMPDDDSSPNAFERDKPGTSGRSAAEAAVEDLRKQGGVFVEAVRATRMPMVLTDPALPGNPIIFANKSFLKLSGYKAEEVLGQQPHFMNGPDTDPNDAARFSEALRSGQDELVETAQYRKDGSRFIATVLVSAFKDEHGRTLNHFMSYFDVTRRAKAEEEVVSLQKVHTALAESEAKYKALFESMDQAYAVVELLKGETEQWADFRFLEVNPAFLQHTSMPYPVGKTATELLGTPNPRWTQLYGQVLDSGTPLRVEETEPLLGRTFDLNIFVLDREKNCVAVLFSNVTERKQAELALAKNEERLRDILGSMNEGFVLFDRDFTIVDVNKETLRRDGRRREDLIGRSHWDAFPGTETTPLGDMYRRVMRDRKPETLEQKYTFPDGRIMWVDARAFPTRDGGVAIFWRDVTERKHADEALRESERLRSAMLDVLPLGLALVDLEGKVLLSNPEWSRFMPNNRIPSQDTERGYRWRSWDKDGQLVERTDFPGARALRGEHVVRPMEFLYDNDGVQSWTSLAAVPLYDANDTVVGAVCVIQDIDEAKRAAEALQGSERHAQVLLAELQHRVRNTLSVVRSIARRTAQNTSDSSDFMSHFDGRLNAFSRVQAVVTRSAGGSVELKSLIEDEMLSLAAHEGEHLHINGPKVCLTARAAESMSLAVHELATNAMKYGALTTPHGRIQVAWKCENDDAGRRLEFKWRESGLDERPVASREGFGHELLLRSLPYDLGAKTEIAFQDDGLSFSMTVPLGPEVIASEGSLPS